MTMAAASNITMDEITSRRDALFNRFTKSSVIVFSAVKVDVTVLVAVVVMVLVKFSSLICVKVVTAGVVSVLVTVICAGVSAASFTVNLIVSIMVWVTVITIGTKDVLIEVE